jgi:hypothetical protein
LSGLLLGCFQNLDGCERLTMSVGLEGKVCEEVSRQFAVAGGSGGLDSDMPVALGGIVEAGIARQPSA